MAKSLDYEFICPICHDILQEPFLTECCGQHEGQHFCAGCITNSKRRLNNYCPCCRHEPVNGIIDKHFRRRLKDVLKDMNLLNIDSEQVSSEQQTSEITEQMIMNTSDFEQESSEQGSEHTSEISDQKSISNYSDSEQESIEQFGNELNVLHSPEAARDEQGSSIEQRTRDVDVVRDAERRVDNAVQLATTVSGTGLGGVGAALGGVGIGAAIGSVVPGVGTLIGGTIGGIAGGISGVAGGTLIGFGVGKITNKLRRNLTIGNRRSSHRPTRPQTYNMNTL